MKEMILSFGIGASIGGSFSKAFKTANDVVDGVNKKILEVKKSQSQLNELSSLKSGLGNISKEISTTNTEILSLSGKIKTNTDRGKELQKTYSGLNTEIRKVESNSNSIKTRMAELKTEIKSGSGNTKELKQEYENLKKELAVSTTTLKPLKNRMKEVTKEIEGNKKESTQLERKYQSLDSKSKNLSRSYQNQDEKIKKVTENLKRQNVSVDDVAKSYDNLEKKAAAYNKALEKYEKSKKVKEAAGRVSSVGTVALGAGAAMTGLGVGIARDAIKAESAFADVKKQFDFANKEDELKFKSELQKIITEKKIAISLDELYGAAATAGQSGLKENEAIPYIEAATKMGVAFGMSREEAAKYMFTWRNAFGKTLPELEELTDQINYLGNNTGATETQISEFLTRLGNIPKLAGMAENQTAALGASLIEMGMAPEVAATGAKKLINALTAGKAVKGNEQKAFDMLGINPQYLAKQTQKDPEKAMEKVFQRLSKLKAEDQAAVMKMLFGEEGKVAGANIMKSYDKYKQNLAMVKDKNIYGGATEKEYENRKNTTENDLMVLKAQFAIVTSELGTELLPLIKEGSAYLMEFLKKITQMMKENPKGVKKLIGNLVKLTAGLYGAGVALKGISLGMSGYSTYLKIAGKLTEHEVGTKIISGFGRLGRVGGTVLKGLGKGITTFGRVSLKALLGIGKMGMAALASPVTWIIAGIIALVAAGYLLYKNWDKIKEKTAPLRAAIADLIDKYWFLLGPIGYVLKAGRLIYKNWDVIKEKGLELKDAVVEMVAKWVENWDEFKTKSSEILGKSFDWIEGKWTSVKDAGMEVIDFFIEAYNKIDGIFSGIGNKISTGWNSTKSFFGFGTPNNEIPGYATGGIVTAPTLAMIGEGGSSEAVIPLKKDDNSLSLWEKTGRFLGAYENKNETVNNSTSKFEFVYAPVVTVKDSIGVKEVLNKDARMKYQEFNNFMEKWQRENKRRGNGR